MLVQQKEKERQEMQHKFEEERREVLLTDSEQWVRMLLQSSKASEPLHGFAASVERIDAKRRAAAESVREQQAFIAVLQAALYSKGCSKGCSKAFIAVLQAALE